MCPREQRKLLEKCAMTALSSKLISQQKAFFAKMVVDAVIMLDDLLQLKMIGIKKVQGGALEVSLLQPPRRLLLSHRPFRQLGKEESTQ